VTLRERALNLLARREHGRAELARKLAPHAEGEDLDALLDGLEREGLLSDARYAETVGHARSGRYGSLRLKQELREKGVPEALVSRTVATAREQDLAACRAVWLKKFGALAGDLKEKSRQYRFLIGRGFPAEVVARVVGGLAED
jgi:regulatory protein